LPAIGLSVVGGKAEFQTTEQMTRFSPRRVLFSLETVIPGRNRRRFAKFSARFGGDTDVL
jgi:hypothetical protein